MISFYIVSRRLFLKREGLSDARVVSITKKEYSLAVDFCKDSESFDSQYLMND